MGGTQGLLHYPSANLIFVYCYLFIHTHYDYHYSRLHRRDHRQQDGVNNNQLIGDVITARWLFITPIQMELRFETIKDEINCQDDVLGCGLSFFPGT